MWNLIVIVGWFNFTFNIVIGTSSSKHILSISFWILQIIGYNKTPPAASHIGTDLYNDTKCHSQLVEFFMIRVTTESKCFHILVKLNTIIWSYWLTFGHIFDNLNNRNPREASSRSRICFSACLFVHDLLTKRKTLQTWNLVHTLP